MIAHAFNATIDFGHVSGCEAFATESNNTLKGVLHVFRDKSSKDHNSL